MRILQYIAITVALHLCLLNTHSQSTDRAFKLFGAGQYEAAALEFEKALPLIEKMHGSTDTSYYSFILVCAAVSYERTGQYPKAEGYYLKAKAIYEQHQAFSDEGYLTVLNNLAGLYRTTGNFKEAETLYLDGLEIRKKTLGEEHPDYAATLNKVALLYQSMGDYEKAEHYDLQALGISMKLFGEEHPETIILYGNLTALYHKMGRYEEAESRYMNALKINKTVFGEEHPAYASTLNNLGALYDDMGQYDKAESMYRHALDIRKKVLGTTHPDYAVSVNNLAQLYFTTGRYEEAESMYLEALEVTGKAYGKEHPDYALALNNLGALYYRTGNYRKAELNYQEALKIKKKVLGTGHPEYATALNNLALLYQETGNYEESGELYQKVLEINKKTIGEEHPEFAVSLNNLALLYHETGDYGKAESYYLHALEIVKNTLGEDHPDYAVSLNNMALFYQDMGNYEKAESHFVQALEINKKTLGERHPEYANSLHNLALFYQDLGQLEKAERLFLEALKIRKKSLGEEHPDFASSLHSLAGLYHESGDYRKAERNYLEALEIRRKVFGQEHINCAIILNNLARLYDDMGRPEDAGILYRQASEIFRDQLGEKHPDYAAALANLAEFHHAAGQLEKAEPIYQQAMQNYYSLIKQYFGFLSEKEKEKYLARVLFFFTAYHNCILQRRASNPAGTGDAYDMELANKELVMRSARQLRMCIMGSDDSTAINTYHSWMSIRASLAHQYALPEARQTLDLKALEEEANELEKRLTQFSSIHGDFDALQNVHWEDVRNRLDPSEAAIEFAHFGFYNGNQWTDSILYVALVLKHDDLYPGLIPLFKESQMDSLLQKDNNPENEFINRLYSWGNSGNGMHPGHGQRLHELLWEPLEKYLDGITNIYFSPSGCLHYLSFAAIPCSENDLLSDRYNLYQLSSTARIILDPQGKPVKNMVLFGGIDYGDGPWSYLDGTLTEVEMIKHLAEKKGIKSQMITGDEALEETIKTLQGDGSPEVLHIATHGFFFSDAERISDPSGQRAGSVRGIPAFISSDDPLLRSGLIFAGGNHAWEDKDMPVELEDGILTAYEVSNMYLPNTQLVVLSACETGLGEIKGSEGVFGLKRSFKMAGTDYILMSLWHIPDYQTSELMNRFYLEWFSGIPVPEAYIMAQKFMKSKYPGQPYMWAGFVLIR